MYRLKILTVLTMLLVSAAVAQAQDNIGIFWDAAFTQSDTVTTAPYDLLNGHIVIMNPSVGGGILAWECEVDIEGPALVSGWQIEGQAINAASPPRFAVGLASPLPPAAATKVASFQMFVTEIEPVNISLKAMFNASVPGEMAYLGNDLPDQLTVMTPVTGEPLVATVNANIPVAHLDPVSISFGELGSGESLTMNLRVSNIGGGILPLNLSIDGDPGFSLSTVAGAVNVAAGEFVDIPITFSPAFIGSASAVLSLGDVAPATTLRGVGREPIVSWTAPTHLDFGKRVIGSTKYLDSYIRNTGEAPLELNVSLTAACPDYTIISGGGTFTLEAGQKHFVRVNYIPQSLGVHICSINYGPDYPLAHMTGEAFPDEVLYTVTPPNLDFYPTDVGETRTDRVIVYNTGAVPFSLNIGWFETCDGFAITSGGGSRYVGVDGSIAAYIRFTPTILGFYSCLLQLGEGYPDVRVTGTGAGNPPTINPTRVDFPLTEVGTSRTQVVEITNNGEAPVFLTPTLANADPAFTITSGTAGFYLDPDQTYNLLVQFAPPAEQTYTDQIDVGAGFNSIPLSGTGGTPVYDCDVSANRLEFVVDTPTVSPPQTLSVTNLGNVPLHLVPTVGAPEFAVTPAAVTVDPGQTSYFQVMFTPSVAGTTTATLVLGAAACATVELQGTLDYGFAPDENLVGFFFDSDFSAIETGLADGMNTVLVHLAMINPSDPAGIAGWECRIASTGGSSFEGWTLAGNAINAGNPYDPNEFTVGIGLEPLPYAAEGVLLATFELLIVDTDPSNVSLELHPKYNPSVPGAMSWVPWSDPTRLIAMLPFTGQSTVAWINPNAPVGTEAPTPLAVQLEGRVDLEWPMRGEDGDGYHVYRQAPQGSEERLTAEPMPATTATIRFSDRPDYPGGTVLRYSYAVVRDGAELTRSPAIEVTVKSLPLVRTQLLSNVPNPFNPQTEIRFQLAQASQVRITIYDVTGRLVRTLVNEQRSAGEGHVVWQGRDDSGRQVSSGAYYVRLENEGRMDHRKIMMLK